MRKLSLILAIVVLPVWLLAQDVPKGEAFGGYSYLATGGQGFNGFNGQFTYNRSEALGITGDVGGSYAGQSVNVSGIGGVSAHTRTYTFLVGPTYSYRKLDKLVPFGHLLLGLAHGSTRAQTSILGGPSVNISTSGNGFGLAFGGGVDYELNEGDSIYYNSGLPHRAKVVGNQEAEIVSAISPPTF